MIAVADNDVIAKLARYSLLSEFEKYVKKRRMVIQLQPSIHATFDLAGKSPTLKKLKTVEERDAIASLAARSSTIKLRSEGEALLELCYLVEGIDPGDSIWLCFAASTTGCMIFTGDKRALRAVCAEPKCAPITSALASRVMCLEQIVLELFELDSFVGVRNKVRADMLADEAVLQAFPEKTTTRADATMVLTRHIERLRSDTGNLLLA